MSKSVNLVAVDLGASSGRVVLTRIAGDHLSLEEAHRFANGPVRVHDHLLWDALHLFDEIKTGLGKARHMAPISSLGLDAWGVDYALLDREDSLVGNPYHYRDARTNGIPDKVFAVWPRNEIFERTGIQTLQFNSLFQLFAQKDSAALDQAHTFLMIPDLYNYWLTGCKANEYSEATTTQFYNPHIHQYDRQILTSLDLPTDIFPEIISSGTNLGPLLASVSEETGLPPIPVIAPACHDTGSAVAAAPLNNPRAAYISSGTWSLVGAEVSKPVITPLSLAHNFTNEGGVGNTIRLLKNVTGLWLAQECRRNWSLQGKNYTWDEISSLAEAASPFGSLIDPDHPDFLNPGDMPGAIRDFCSRTGQPSPGDHAAIMRCIFESLALKYRWALTCLEALLGFEVEVIHVIGGGSKNKMLCQLTADATGKPVIAGPVETTAIGNAIVQALTLGLIGSLAEGRELVARSFPLQEYQPRRTNRWDEAAGRFASLGSS